MGIHPTFCIIVDRDKELNNGKTELCSLHSVSVTSSLTSLHRISISFPFLMLDQVKEARRTVKTATIHSEANQDGVKFKQVAT
ncbi:hypothetical protein HHK36_028849 [Tetracentron sinense]|uniref:Uncharacterized protein n=1 Tax=Tetracentron sinense TaxID=13715 RepID=A0A834YDV3_TETSI|nr:hypothetical protein HHK36_028849 [Tetracentron sinense]